MIPGFVSRSYLRLMLSAAAALPVACESSTGPHSLPVGVEVRTSASAFVVDTAGTSKRATIIGTVANSSGRTLVMTTHDVAEGLALGDRWAILAGGGIADGGACRDLTAAALEARYFEILAGARA